MVSAVREGLGFGGVEGGDRRGDRSRERRWAGNALDLTRLRPRPVVALPATRYGCIYTYMYMYFRQYTYIYIFDVNRPGASLSTEVEEWRGHTSRFSRDRVVAVKHDVAQRARLSHTPSVTNPMARYSRASLEPSPDRGETLATVIHGRSRDDAARRHQCPQWRPPSSARAHLPFSRTRQRCKVRGGGMRGAMHCAAPAETALFGTARSLRVRNTAPVSTRMVHRK